MKTINKKKNSNTLIHHFLENSAERFPDKVAFIHEETREPYHNINSAADSLANCLRDNGVKKGSRVVMLFENCLEYVISYYGILKSGAIAVPLSSDLKPEGLRPILIELEPDVIIASGRFERMLKATGLEPYNLKFLIVSKPKLKWPETSFLRVDFEEVTSENMSDAPDVRITPDDIATIIYTSGSTGTPKGAMLSHKNVIANTNSICEYLKLTDNDIQMVVLPFFYVMGKSLLNTHFAVGGTIVVNNKFAYPATVIQQMIDEKVTGFSGVPSTFAYLLHRSPLKSKKDELVTLRYCSQAGGHMASHIKTELLKVIPNKTRLFIMYGATEASARLAYLPPEFLEEKIDSIGKAIPGVQLKVIDSSGDEKPAGETGELVGSGDNIMQGYWEDETLTSKVLDANGYHTGDLCFKDEDGFFFLVGRKDDLLKVGGHRINPQEIEDVLMASDLAVELTVFGIPDELLGNKLIVIAVKKEELCSENIILNYCNGVLPKYKHPSRIIFTKTLPKKVNGKIDRVKCVELLKDKR